MTDTTRPISQKVSVADPGAPSHVLKPNADGSINVVGGGGGGGDVNISEVAGNAAAAGAGATTSGTLRTVTSSDSPDVASLAILESAATSDGPVLAPTAATPVSGAITTSMTDTTREKLLPAPGAGLYNYITTIIISNASSTVGTDVTINDGDTTDVLLTIPAAINYGGAVITLPVPLKQPTADAALYCANVTTGSSTKASVVGYTGA